MNGLKEIKERHEKLTSDYWNQAHMDRGELISMVEEQQGVIDALDDAWERAKERWNIAERERDANQAKIDALMFEYWPDEMTDEQVAEWGKHQVLGDSDELQAALKAKSDE